MVMSSPSVGKVEGHTGSSDEPVSSMIAAGSGTDVDQNAGLDLNLPASDVSGSLENSSNLQGISQSVPNVGSEMGLGSGSMATNQSAMGSVIGLQGEGMTSGNDYMLPVPDMTQQSGGVNSIEMGSSSGVNAQHKNIKIWEGSLFAQRQGQPVFICKLESYRPDSASATLAADWPSTLQIVRLIRDEHMNNEQCVRLADNYLVFRTFQRHGFLTQIQEMKLLPSRTLFLAVSDKPNRLNGMLIQGKVILKPRVPLQPQQEEPEQQQQLQPQQEMESQPLSGMQPEQQVNGGISDAMRQIMQTTLHSSTTSSGSSTQAVIIGPSIQQDKIVQKPRGCKICGGCKHKRRRRD